MYYYMDLNVDIYFEFVRNQGIHLCLKASIKG
jgi:hypothetical protein